MHRPPPATTAARTDPIAPATDDWPTTRRFSRRAGEAFRSADYAAAVELPAASRVGDAIIAIVMVIGPTCTADVAPHVEPLIPALRRYARSLVRNREMAENLVQDREGACEAAARA